MILLCWVLSYPSKVNKWYAPKTIWISLRLHLFFLMFCSVAELFHQLSQALAVLTDAAARVRDLILCYKCKHFLVLSLQIKCLDKQIPLCTFFSRWKSVRALQMPRVLQLLHLSAITCLCMENPFLVHYKNLILYFERQNHTLE